MALHDVAWTTKKLREFLTVAPEGLTEDTLRCLVAIEETLDLNLALKRLLLAGEVVAVARHPVSSDDPLSTDDFLLQARPRQGIDP